ncbi:MAG: hypothetical protein GY856_40670, partial [bacterium]|nr:hypothetical protein [bacterium]
MDIRSWDREPSRRSLCASTTPGVASSTVKTPPVSILTPPQVNPGAHVVSLLEGGPAPWVIVTNGKLWRLYSRRAHSRATNYYEIDLEEVLVHPGDVSESFRYFWLLFRRQAFEPREVSRDGRRREESLADYLLAESEAYAQELGERLKEKVFEQVFP